MVECVFCESKTLAKLRENIKSGNNVCHNHMSQLGHLHYVETNTQEINYRLSSENNVLRIENNVLRGLLKPLGIKLPSAQMRCEE